MRACRNCLIRSIYDRIHSSASEKLDIIKRISLSMEICDNYVTTHFLVSDEKIFGLTVTHFDCEQAPHPEWLVPCPGLDIAILTGCPPDVVSSVMNITGRVVPAKMGDSASLLGFVYGNQERASIGNLVGVYGIEQKGQHFSSHVFDSWIYQGDIFAGMSGSCVLNGMGNSCCILFFFIVLRITRLLMQFSGRIHRSRKRHEVSQTKQ